MKKFIFSIIALLGILMPNTVWAEDETGTAEPYAVLSWDNAELVFYYDDQKTERGGLDIGPFNQSADRGWNGAIRDICQVVFDESFKDCKSISSTAFWFDGCVNLEQFYYISNFNTENVTNMRNMFSGCTSLSRIDVSGFVTDNVTDMQRMFNGCEKLWSLNVSGFKTDNVTNMNRMFYECSSLATIDVSNFKTDNVTDMSYMFYHCSKVNVLDVSGFKTDNVTSMGYMFAGCSKLTALDVSGFNTTNVTGAGLLWMFSGCSGVTTLDVSRFKTDNVTNMAGMFNGCSSVTTLDVSGFKTDNATDLNSMFKGCSKVNVLDISGFKTDNVTNLSDMFSGCSSITFLDISGFKTDNVTNMSGLFNGCSGVTTLDISRFRTDNVTDMSSMFSGCSGLSSLDIREFKTDNVTKISSMFSGCSGLTNLDISSLKTDNVTNISGLFNGCSGLTTLDVSTLNTDNVTNMSSLFANCSGLATLDVSSLNTEKVTDMSSMFSGCGSLKSIDVSNFKTDNVKNMNSMFYFCQSLTLLDLCNFNTENVEDMQSMFRACLSLVTIFVSNWSLTSHKSSRYMFDAARSLEGGKGTLYDDYNSNNSNYAHIDEGVSNPGYFSDKSSTYEMPYAVLTDSNTVLRFCYDSQKSSLCGRNVQIYSQDLNKKSWPWWNNINTRKSIKKVIIDRAFANCKEIKNTSNWFSQFENLESIEGLGYLNTESVTNMSDMFSSCVKLKALDVSGFNTANVTNMDGMFAGCDSLTSLDLASFKTDSVTNMSSMFNHCSNLTSLNLSSFNTEKVTRMGASDSELEGMFFHCSALKKIYVSENWSTTNVANSKGMFGYCYSLIGGAGTIYDEKNTDHSYAHIDRGPDNPGYFTDIADKGKEKMEQVATPTFMFSGDQLFISSDTEDAKIFYATSSINGDGTTNANGTRAMTANDITYTEYTDPLFITSDTIIMAKAVKDGMEDSEVNTLTYYYSAWMELLNAMDYGNQIYKQSERNENVSQDLREQLSSLISRAEVCYYSDRATTDYHEVEKLTHHIMEYAKQIEEQMQPTEKVAAPTFGFEGYDLTMATETEGATIRYMMEEWTYENIDSAYVQADKMTVDISGAIYDGPLGTVTHNMIVKAYASKDGMADSDISTLVYYGKAWLQLQDVIAYGERLINEANGNEKVNQELVQNLKWALDEGAMMYERRAEAPGQEATMWIERISELCKQIEEQMNATTEQVETPKFKFTNNILELVTETLDAKIYYAIQEFDNDLETDTIAKYARNLQVSVDSIEYKDPIEANYDFIIKAMAVKEGMENSKDTTYIYPYTEWMKLLATIEIGKSLTSSILNENPSESIIDMLEILKDHMEEDNYTYLYDRTKWDRETVIYERYRLEDEIKHIDLIWQEEKSMQTTATYENYTLTVEGETTMAQALEQVGGRNVVAKDIAAIVWNSSQAITRSDIEGFGNPNLLIYVQTDSLAPEGVNNVVINGNAKSITLVDAESNNNFYAPMAFTAESISYTREFKQTTEKDVSRGWEGIALPFTVQKFTHESHGEIAPFGNDASIFHFWLHQMTDKGMVNATTIEANKPYIISMPNNGSYPEAYNQAGKVTFSAENVTVPVSDNTAIWTADGTIGMMSTYLRIEPSEYIYALNVGSAIEGYAEGSAFVQNLREVKPFEVFTFHEENHHEGAGARFISVSSLFGGEGTTGIIDVMKNAEPNGETWYDLNGLRLQSKPSRKGVYIKNGKKVVVK